jgi:hypothetical protein
MRDISRPTPQPNSSFGSIYNQIAFFLFEKKNKKKSKPRYRSGKPRLREPKPAESGRRKY